MSIAVPSHVRDAIDRIMDEFDFSRVEQTMRQLKWKWAYTETPDQIPSQSDLRRQARQLLISAWEQLERQSATQNTSNGGMYYSCGGLEAMFDFNNREGEEQQPYDISLKFVVEQVENF